MTGSDLAVRDPQPVNVLSTEQLRYIANTDFVPAGLRGNLPAILACVATGRAIGVDDMTAIRSVHIIDGKPTFSAELMVQLVRRRGHSITGELTEGAATVTGTRADNGDTMKSTWTLAMADRAGLLSKQNWKKYPESMLWARAVSQLCRMLFADCFAGATYTTEELGEEHTDQYGALAEPGVAESRADTSGRDTDEGRSALASRSLHEPGSVSVPYDDDGLFPPIQDSSSPEPDLPPEPSHTDEAGAGEGDLPSPSPAAGTTLDETTTHSDPDPAVVLADEAARFVPPNGKYSAGGADGPRTLSEILAVNEGWFRWALKNVTVPPEYRQALEHFTRVYLPELLS